MFLQMLFRHRPAKQAAQDSDQLRSGLAQFVPVSSSQVFQDRLPLRGEPDSHLTAIFRSPASLNEIPVFEPIYQSDRAVMTDEKMTGQFPHSGIACVGERPDRQKHLVLLRFQTFFAGLTLAEMQKLPDSIPEIGQRAVVRRGQVEGRHGKH